MRIKRFLRDVEIEPADDLPEGEGELLFVDARGKRHLLARVDLRPLMALVEDAGNDTDEVRRNR